MFTCAFLLVFKVINTYVQYNSTKNMQCLHLTQISLTNGLVGYIYESLSASPSKNLAQF